jgi:hypothetical protein
MQKLHGNGQGMIKQNLPGQAESRPLPPRSPNVVLCSSCCCWTPAEEVVGSMSIFRIRFLRDTKRKHTQAHHLYRSRLLRFYLGIVVINSALRIGIRWRRLLDRHVEISVQWMYKVYDDMLLWLRPIYLQNCLYKW